jgi:2-polyprenyl-6-methoxyphenol hydroxylase-like FAD-dependent oxidoreductase
MTEHAVIIVGGGPTGMMLAAELRLAGVDALLLERRADAVIESARSGGLHARTLEVLDQRGIGDRIVAAGRPAQVTTFAAPLDISDFPTRRPYALALWQNRFERLLAAWVDELGAPVRRGCEVTGFTQDADGVDMRPAHGEPLRARYLVGCDGGRSAIRRAAGITLEGSDASASSIVGEVRLREPAEPRFDTDAKGTYALGPLDETHHRVVVRDEELTTAEPTLDELRAGMIALWGTDYGLVDARFLSRFTDAARQASAYRAGRVLLAGDAAHVHSPVGGQGLNVGLQDAVNLGWKLALVAGGHAPDTLLDSYDAERRPVIAGMLRDTMAITALMRGDARNRALRECVADLMQLGPARRHMAGRLSQLTVHYELGEGHPLLGRRMPDVDLVTAGGPTTAYAFLHRAQPLLLNLDPRCPLDAAAPWGDRVPVVDAAREGAWELPVLGEVDAPSAVLVRPDGHVAWVGDGDPAHPGLTDALETWFGPPSRSISPGGGR